MGTGWVIFEIAYILFVIIILGVVSASAGSIVHELFGISKWVEIIDMSAAIFLLVINGSKLIETGSGLIYSITDRIEEAICLKGNTAPKWITPFTALVLMGVTIFISSFGLMNLISKGYGTLAWIFFFVCVIPILTLGTYKIWKAKKYGVDAVKKKNK